MVLACFEWSWTLFKGTVCGHHFHWQLPLSLPSPIIQHHDHPSLLSPSTVIITTTVQQNQHHHQLNYQQHWQQHYHNHCCHHHQPTSPLKTFNTTTTIVIATIIIAITIHQRVHESLSMNFHTSVCIVTNLNASMYMFPSVIIAKSFICSS